MSKPKQSKKTRSSKKSPARQPLARVVREPAPREPTPREPAPRRIRVSEPVTLNLYEAKTHLSELVARAAAGEEIVIAKARTPMARLVPLVPAERPALRQPGGWEGKIWVADDFDDPLPPEIQRYFDDPQIFLPDDANVEAPLACGGT